MDELFDNLDRYYKNCNDDLQNEKSIYEELAEKEEALQLAAQFGKTLIEEKEQLEYQIEVLKREYQNKIEMLEQERYGLKLLIESTRNEYENKINELNEDMNIIHKQLETQRNEIQIKNNENNACIEIINDLNEKNFKLIQELKNYQTSNYCLEEKLTKLKDDMDEKENKFSENLKVLNSFKKEISIQVKKNQELDYLLMQTCSDRDKQNRLLEEQTNRLNFIDREKNRLDEIVFQQEQQILDLQAVNEELNHKIKKYHNNTSNNIINRPSKFNCIIQQKYNNDNNSNLKNAKSLYDEDLDEDISYENDLDIFRIEDDDNDDDDIDVDINYSICETNLNWQDECQISEQQINQNTNQFDDFGEDDSLSSTSTFNTIIQKNDTSTVENSNNKTNNDDCNNIMDVMSNNNNNIDSNSNSSNSL